ncbi:hypothetical protein AB833_08695 [Chromatiales bacterium (ex Bugula neritina AB1)]|nr:hypothetical protein AB833_08695 [Chromatiales bacterium (ex Bugula neritina AB1)]
MTVATINYQSVKPRTAGYLILLLALASIAAFGLYSAYIMEHAGHHITGMTNRVVWGLPHVFAVSLIVAASGALNGASLASVFNNDLYKPYARCSVALAVSLLIGGLLVLVLDLGRPDRLVIAVTHFNFRSIFSWNVFLYTGFIAIGIVYLWFLCERRYRHRIKQIAIIALIWRIMLTTGTGCIFGFLVGRDSLDTALLAPMFIALSLVTGTAVFALCLHAIARVQRNPITCDTIRSLSKLLIWFMLALGYFALVHHLTNLYVAEHALTEQLALTGPNAGIFWFGFVVAGLILPTALLLKNSLQKSTIVSADNTESNREPGEAQSPNREAATSVCNTSKNRLVAACVAALAGSACLVYVVIIGSQTAPQKLFPGKTVVASSFGDKGVASYQPSIWEWGLGAGGIAIALLIFIVLLRLFPFTAVRR